MNTICFKIADAADNLKLMKEKKDKLEEELKEIEQKMESIRLSTSISEETRTAELKNIKTTHSNLLAGFCDMESYNSEIKSVGLFKSSAVARNNNLSSSNRVKSYVNELASSKKIKTKSEEEFINMMDSY